MAGLFQNLFAKVFQSFLPRPPRDTIEVLAEIQERKLLQKIRAEEADRLRREQRPAAKNDLRDVVKKVFRDAEARENQEKRQIEEAQAREPWYRFIHLGIPINNGSEFTSSNVSSIQYDIATKSLYVEFRSGHASDGRTYRFWTVDERLAVAFYNAMSKGTFVWDNLRIRGTMLGHRLNYMLVGGASRGGSILPTWTGSDESVAAHEAQAGLESGAEGPAKVLGLGETGPEPQINPPYKALGKFALASPKQRRGTPQVE